MARKKATAKASDKALPASNDIPAGMKQMGGSYAPTWTPEKEGESIHGTVSDKVREVEFKQGRKAPVKRRVMEVTTIDGENSYAVWESAALGELFDSVVELGDDAIGTEVYLRFDGLGKKKAGQNPPKLFTVAMAA